MYKLGFCIRCTAIIRRVNFIPANSLFECPKCGCLHSVDEIIQEFKAGDSVYFKRKNRKSQLAYIKEVGKGVQNLTYFIKIVGKNIYVTVQADELSRVKVYKKPIFNEIGALR